MLPITGQYWRFQEHGHSAVSTIEAIAHTALTAARARAVTNTCIASKKESDCDCDKLFESLLLLFQVQKYRVLKRVSSEGGRAPKAIKVSGVGLGDWSYLTTPVHPSV